MFYRYTLTALYNTRGTPEDTWLDALHRDLDVAVATAYGRPACLRSIVSVCLLEDAAAKGGGEGRLRMIVPARMSASLG